jgi:hypothetical protein
LHFNSTLPAKPIRPLVYSALRGNTTGNFNTASGFRALLSNTTGLQNTATGAFGPTNNTTGSFNTANGSSALGDNTTGVRNTANGEFALGSNTTGNGNTANGAEVLSNNTTGDDNTATGSFALHSNTTGFSNTGIGVMALSSNTVGNVNTATGLEALRDNIDGEDNTANGYRALFVNTTGDNNTAIGVLALSANTSGAFNTALGRGAGNGVSTANNVIAIGISAENVSNSCYIGQIYPNVQPQVGTDPDYVTVNSDGRLGRANVFSRRYKHDIRPMHTASEAIYALKPVSFRYHKQYDRTQTVAFGQIAEEVAEVNPDLVGRNSEGQPESVRYEQINAMLLNEFLKAHKVIEEQQATIAQLKKEMQTMVARLNEHDSKIQSVSDQVQINSPEARVVVRNR